MFSILSVSVSLACRRLSSVRCATRLAFLTSRLRWSCLIELVLPLTVFFPRVTDLLRALPHGVSGLGRFACLSYRRSRPVSRAGTRVVAFSFGGELFSFGCRSAATSTESILCAESRLCSAWRRSYFLRYLCSSRWTRAGIRLRESRGGGLLELVLWRLVWYFS